MISALYDFYRVINILEGYMDEVEGRLCETRYHSIIKRTNAPRSLTKIL